jgi:isopentenyl diphosphate isomerase/L-lactate dehydrogenase-like FMN-dependent dehydrogenase
VLRNVDGTDVTRSAFGAKRRLPVLLAPLGGMTEFHEAGALSERRGCARSSAAS